MSVLRPVNLALKFVLELAALAAFAVFGADLGDGVWSVLLALAAVSAGVVLWGTWAAPRAPRRLPDAARIPFELGFFALAVAAFALSGLGTVAVVFAVAVVLNAVLLTAFGDWRA